MVSLFLFYSTIFRDRHLSLPSSYMLYLYLDTVYHIYWNNTLEVYTRFLRFLSPSLCVLISTAATVRKIRPPGDQFLVGDAHFPEKQKRWFFFLLGSCYILLEPNKITQLGPMWNGRHSNLGSWKHFFLCFTHTHTLTHTCIYIYVCVCMYVYMDAGYQQCPWCSNYIFLNLVC